MSLPAGGVRRFARRLQKWKKVGPRLARILHYPPSARNISRAGAHVPGNAGDAALASGATRF
ncbi:MAG: hypothetical protein H6662_02890 [Ardenticatenaceae bacterium]|nr:hypothetical protein [Ardenticatenaceae bacterium]